MSHVTLCFAVLCVASLCFVLHGLSKGETCQMLRFASRWCLHCLAFLLEGEICNMLRCVLHCLALLLVAVPCWP